MYKHDMQTMQNRHFADILTYHRLQEAIRGQMQNATQITIVKQSLNVVQIYLARITIINICKKFFKHFEIKIL